MAIGSWRFARTTGIQRSSLEVASSLEVVNGA